jgi:hypothetical protein
LGLAVGFDATTQSKRNWEWKTTGFSLLSATRRRILTPGYRYNLFNAADEKIPLSMVHVNKKPQHLVFSLHSRHLPAK